jgi:hypothetical protein
MNRTQLSGEMITRDRAFSYFSMIGSIPNPDKILRRTGKTIEAYRDLLLNGRFPDASLGVAALMSIAMCGFGFVLFKRVEFRFADIV